MVVMDQKKTGLALDFDQLRAPASWVAVTVATFFLAWLVTSPQPCQKVSACAETLREFPNQYGSYSAAALFAMCLHELVSLFFTYAGVKETQTLVPTLRSKCLPSLLLASMFATLGLVHATYDTGDLFVSHASRGGGFVAEGRPIYTMTFFEWVMDVPLMMVLSGYCAMGRPISELSGPVVVTNIYIIFCWASLTTSSATLRWSLIAMSWVMYTWASREMLGWVSNYERTAPQDLPSRSLRPVLSVGLIALFFVYGMVFTASVTGIMDAHSERMFYLCATLTSKLAFSIAFVIIRADEYHQMLTGVLKKVSISNIGMVSIMRGTFDLLLPCTVDAGGRIWFPLKYTGDMAKLESYLGRSVAGVNMKELLAGADDKEQLAAYVRNVMRQADAPQAFSGASLSEEGDWSCGGQGQMPPLAQILNCHFERKVPAKRGAPAQVQGSELSVRVHLSVVPRSMLSFCKERQMVAAIQVVEENREPDQSEEPAPRFESFKATKEDGVSTVDDDNSDRDSQAPTSPRAAQGIIANLADLAKLGVSTFLHGASETACSEDICPDGGTFDFPASVASGETMSHLGQFADALPMPKEPQHQLSNAAERIVGSWRGTVSKQLGGYEQTITISRGVELTVAVLGRNLRGLYKLDSRKEPWKLDIQVVPEGAGAAPASIQYIARLKDNCLYLCGPVAQNMQRPREFEGPGLCVMHRLGKDGQEVDELGDSSTAFERLSTGDTTHSFSAVDPGNAFSRESTMETCTGVFLGRQPVVASDCGWKGFAEVGDSEMLDPKSIQGVQESLPKKMDQNPVENVMGTNTSNIALKFTQVWARYAENPAVVEAAAVTVLAGAACLALQKALLA